MTTELLAMLGGGFSGFVFKLIGTMVQNQAAITEGLIKKQKHQTESADAAAKRVDAFGAWTETYYCINSFIWCNYCTVYISTQ